MPAGARAKPSSSPPGAAGPPPQARVPSAAKSGRRRRAACRDPGRAPPAGRDRAHPSPATPRRTTRRSARRNLADLRRGDEVAARRRAGRGSHSSRVRGGQRNRHELRDPQRAALADAPAQQRRERSSRRRACRRAARTTNQMPTSSIGSDSSWPMVRPRSGSPDARPARGTTRRTCGTAVADEEGAGEHAGPVADRRDPPQQEQDHEQAAPSRPPRRAGSDGAATGRSRGRPSPRARRSAAPPVRH